MSFILPGRSAAAPPSGTDPYPLYPSFDRNTVPWHTTAGGYGPSVPLEAPTLPTTTRSVTVNTTGEFNTEAAVNGTQITIGTGWAGTVNVGINANDIDVIIPSGISIGGIEIGTFPWNTSYARIRIRGTTPGSHSGGRMGQLLCWDLGSGRATDVVIDGIDMNGDSGFATGETNQCFRGTVTRVAILNSRIISAGYGLLGAYAHMFIGNTNWYSGAATRAQVGYDMGWGIRCTMGPITIVDSRIQTTRYAVIRAQAIGNPAELLYIGNSLIVNVAEGQTLWIWEDLDGGTLYTGEGGLVENSTIYAYNALGCGYGAEFRTSDVTWAEVKNNTFYSAGASVFSQSTIDAAVKGGGVGTGNTFNTLTAGGVPAWGGPGDPTSVPLPAGLTLIEGEGVCPAGP